MNMKIKKAMEQLDDFFDLSKKKQNKRCDKLTKIILSLEEKKSDIKNQLKRETRKDKKSNECYELCKEFKVILKLIKKAKKHCISE